MKKLFIILVIALFVFPVSLGRSNGSDGSRSAQNNNMGTSRTNLPIPLQRFKTTTMISMRDGIHLATDVYRPIFRSSPHGTILIRTPYNKDSLSIVGILGILRGWPMVIQDMRGRSSSEGIDTGFKNDSADGADTLAWIVNQSWSNGKIVTYGLSALGIVQVLFSWCSSRKPQLSIHSSRYPKPVQTRCFSRRRVSEEPGGGLAQ